MSGFIQRLAARRFNERVHALMSTRDLPDMSVDLACWRRLEAMRERLQREDPELAEDADAMTHVVYAAIMGGLRESEREAGEVYDENRQAVLVFPCLKDKLAEVVYDMLGGKRDKDGWPHARVVKRVRVVVEVLDAEEHKPPPPPEGPTHDGVDFDPPPAPEVA